MFKVFKKPTVVSVHDTPDLPVIDNDEIAIELNVELLAKQAARSNLPPTNATTPDSNELKFKHEIETKGLQAVSKVNESISNLQNVSLSTSITKELNDIKKIPSEYKSKVKSELQKNMPAFKQDYENYRVHVDQILDFKNKNKLKRNAHYPESSTFTIGILLAFLVIESSLNSVFFAKGSDLGLLGGLLLAAIISALNIIPGFLNGLFILRYLNHISKTKKFMAFIVFLIFFGLSSAFNLLMAHYREALNTDPDSASTVAIESFNKGMVNISESESWMLFSMGMVFFILAVYKGYSSDDEYPRFGKITRNKNKAEDDLREYKEEIIYEIDSYYNEYEEKLDDLYEKIISESNKINTCIASFDSYKSIFQSYKVHLQGTLDYIIKLYRETNASERQDTPPKYFNRSLIAKLNDENMEIKRIDKRNDFVEKKEQLASEIPDLKMQMINIKEEFHDQINKECKF